jgi:hypothetical protein
MPRKQNGFGNPKSLAFNGISKRTDVSKKKGAAGQYPSDRRFGSSVQRSVIEKYNLDSNWTKWRKGYEYYNQAAWYRLQDVDDFSGEYKDSQIQSKLYQGTPYEVDVVFDGYKFATKNADSSNHYVMKRTPVTSSDLGTVTAVYNDDLKYPEYKANRELRVQGNPGADSRLLLQMIGERITDGETEATLNYVLNEKEHPALYVGKTFEEPTEVKVSVDTSTILLNQEFENPQDLVGKIVWIKNFFVEKPISSFLEFEFIDAPYYFGVRTLDKVSNVELEVLDPDSEVLPPSLYDITTLPSIFTSTDASYTVSGQHIFQKELYQKYFGRQYLTGDLVASEVDLASYSILPFRILGVQVDGSRLEFTSVPFTSELKMYAPPDGNSTLVFADYSFTKLSIDEYDGNYYHALGKPGDSPWMNLDTDVDPWMDEVFTTGNALRPATTYTCSCPNHSHAILRAPQQTQDDGTRKINRQRRYPMPTVLGKSDFNAIGTNSAAGLIESWESREHKMSFKMCKHSIAAMFIDKLKVKEPNSYPTVEARIAFEEKLVKEIEEVAAEFGASYKRGGITTLEIIFALAQGLNLDEVETAYVMLNSNF